MGISRVTRNYQVTIPKDVRRTKNIRVGDTLVFTPTEKGAEVRKLPEDPLQAAFGSWGPGPSGVEYVRAIRKEWETRRKRLGL